ncbi:MAG: hypothetical protein WBB45_12510 [Cyclobacteriaceae bacterium]
MAKGTVSKGTEQLYKNLQGNILKFHGRTYAYHLFIQFNQWQQHDAKEWIRRLAEKHITTTHDQIEHSRERRRNPSFDAGLFTSFALSYAGYTYLQLRVIPSDVAFMEGMSARKHLLGDKDEDMYLAYADDLHAFLLIADDSLETVEERKAEIEKELTENGLGRVAVAELGSVQKNAKGDVEMVNGFGYRDGISSPIYLEQEKYEYAEVQKDVAGVEDPLAIYDPGTELEEILVNDMLTREPDTFGSYCVFRKYELSTASFDKQVADIGKKLNEHAGKAEDDAYGMELAAAYMVGRFKDGTPVVKQDIPRGTLGAMDNTFDFKDDAYGARCPFHGHIRKMNPRKNLPDNEPYYPKATVTRRGMNQETDGAVTGLLFSCYQGSIINQFEKLQVAWGNISWEPAGRAGVDPIIGNEMETDDYALAPELSAKPDVGLVPYRQNYSFPNKYGKHSNLPFDLDRENYFHNDFRSHVRMVGGEYFYFPSVPGLKALKEVEAAQNTNTPMLQRLQYVITKLWTSEKNLENFKKDYRTCMNDWLGLHMQTYFKVIISYDPVEPKDVFEIKDGYVITHFDLSGKPGHLSDDEIRALSLDEFMKHNKLSLVTASVLFNPYFLMGW